MRCKKVHPNVSVCSLCISLTNLPNQEAPFDVPENDPGSEWPEHGVVKFENYQVGRILVGAWASLKGRVFLNISILEEFEQPFCWQSCDS